MKRKEINDHKRKKQQTRDKVLIEKRKVRKMKMALITKEMREK